MDTTTVNVNGHLVETGCYIDGHWGQYGEDRLGEVAANFLTVREDQYPSYWRGIAQSAHEREHFLLCEKAWEGYHDAADRLLERLNDCTLGGYWEWHDGELFLVTEAEAGPF